MLEIKVGDLAKTVGVHRNTVTNWIKNGTLKAKPILGKKYLIDEGEFKLFLVNSGVSESIITDFISNNYQSTQIAGVSKSPGNKRLKAKTSIIKKEVPMTTQPLGSITVVGGGIAGIQAAIDLADSGYYVFLIEKSPGIGGGMAKLDKTFPTNDCAM